MTPNMAFIGCDVDIANPHFLGFWTTFIQATDEKSWRQQFYDVQYGEKQRKGLCKVIQWY